MMHTSARPSPCQTGRCGLAAAVAATFSTGPPSFSQPLKPSFRCAASNPMSCSVATVSAERQPEAQWKTYLAPGLAKTSL